MTRYVSFFVVAMVRESVFAFFLPLCHDGTAELLWTVDLTLIERFWLSDAMTPNPINRACGGPSESFFLLPDS